MTEPRSRPPLSSSLLPVRIVHVSDRPDIGLTELGRVCEEDPIFRARLITHVNSAGVGVGRRVTSVQQAIALLGVDGIRDVALDACVSQILPAAIGLATDDDAVLVGLCMRRAVAARMCAELLERSDLNECFVLGLLLDVGIVEQASDNMASALSLARSPASMRIQLARAVGEVEHPVRGARLAESYQLDAQIVQAIECHHDFDPPPTARGEIAWLAERIAAVFEEGDPQAARQRAHAAGMQLGLSVPDVNDVLTKLPALTLEAAERFRRKVDPKPDFESMLADPGASLAQANRNYAELGKRLERLLAEKGRLSERLSRAEQLLASLALSDSLTGLPSERAFDDMLVRDLARAERQRNAVSILIVDPDYLTMLERDHGRAATDEVLKFCGQMLHDMIRASDAAARIGSGQFALILPATEQQGARIVAERVRKRFAEAPLVTSRGPIEVTVSVGIATTRGPGCRGTHREFLDSARAALTQAKREGRNRIVLASAL